MYSGMELMFIIRLCGKDIAKFDPKSKCANGTKIPIYTLVMLAFSRYKQSVPNALRQTEVPLTETGTQALPQQGGKLPQTVKTLTVRLQKKGLLAREGGKCDATGLNQQAFHDP